MSEKRAYRSSVREESAVQTRRRIVGAATDLFVERGYAGTTIDAVAERAGVSRRTVFTSVGSKVDLLKTAWDWAVGGDDQPIAVADRPEIARMRAERDPETLVELWVDQVLRVGARVGSLDWVLARAVDVDPEASALQERIDGERRAGAGMFVAGLSGIGGLRPDVGVEEGADMAWTLMNPLLVRRLRTERGWSEEQVRTWLRRLAKASLLADPT
ncbi:MAG: helix-turn-helix domain-containing protein [Nocardioides sp.]